jgi:hypothetical protein
MKIDELYSILDSIKPNEDDCHILPKSIEKEHIRPFLYLDGKAFLLSRIVLERKLKRKIKPGLLALHHCDIKACINPKHLYEGTYGENIFDRYDKNLSLEQRQKNRRRGIIIGQI